MSAGEALALREIFAGTAAATGEEFFDALVRHLARAMGTTCAWVTEWSEDRRRLRALSFWADGRYVQDYEYDIRGTPCEPVLETRSLVLVPDRVIELYPKDPDLAPLGAVSYMGMPLVDTDGRGARPPRDPRRQADAGEPDGDDRLQHLRRARGRASWGGCAAIASCASARRSSRAWSRPRWTRSSSSTRT